jgi:hypothetical protein
MTGSGVIHHLLPSGRAVMAGYALANPALRAVQDGWRKDGWMMLRSFSLRCDRQSVLQVRPCGRPPRVLDCGGVFHHVFSICAGFCRFDLALGGYFVRARHGFATHLTACARLATARGRWRVATPPAAQADQGLDTKSKRLLARVRILLLHVISAERGGLLLRVRGDRHRLQWRLLPVD